MSVMYICEAGTSINYSEGRVIAETRSGLKTSLPIEMLENLVMFGASHITTNCLIEFLKRGINITYLSKNGNFYGKTESTSHVNINRQRNQFRLGDNSEFCTKFARKIISSKINNQKVGLSRYNRNKGDYRVESSIERLGILEKKVSDCNDINQILGYEGNSAKEYFDAISCLIRNEFKFSGRNKQPPRDPFNSMLSLGYTLLLYEVYAALTFKGINPYAGFMHQDKQGHPALASDMVEEWRVAIVDSLVIELIQNGIVTIDQFRMEDNSSRVSLSDTALKKFLSAFENKMKTETKYLDYTDTKMSYRRAISFQAGVLSKAIDNMDLEIYRPLKIR